MRDIPGQVGPMAEWPRVEAMPGAAEALDAFPTGWVQCVATNAQDSGGGEVARALARVGLREKLSAFFTSGELGVAKPDPGFFQEVARRLKIPPTRLLSVGNDYRKDVEPAKAVGMGTLLVAEKPPFQDLPEADLVVPDLRRLVRELQRPFRER